MKDKHETPFLQFTVLYLYHRATRTFFDPLAVCREPFKCSVIVVLSEWASSQRGTHRVGEFAAKPTTQLILHLSGAVK